MPFFFDHDPTMGTLISSSYVPAGKDMTVAARPIFQYCGKTFITGSRRVSTTSGLRNVQQGDWRIVKRFKKDNLVALVHNCGEPCVVRNSPMVHSASILSGESLHTVWC